MSYTELFSEQWQLIDTVYALGVAANTETNSGAVAVNNFHRLVIIIHPMDINDALDVDIEQATSTSGTLKSVDSGGKDITVATADTKPSVIEIAADELDVSGGYDCINVEITTADTAGDGNDFCVEIWGMPAYKPADTTLLDSVTD